MMAVGVLIETFVVRALLVPALMTLFGYRPGGRAAGSAWGRAPPPEGTT